MKTYKDNKNLRVGLLLAFIFFVSLPILTIKAQLQTFDFSGNDPDSYQCIDNDGKTYLNKASYGQGTIDVYKDGLTGYYLCRVSLTAGGYGSFDYDGVSGNDRAILRPPALQQIEIWFVRILYVIWALVGSFSFFLLVGVGYEYLIRGGTSDQELVKLRKRIINYIIGFVLVFLAIPILTTVFKLLGVNNQVACYNVQLPGFQFFFQNVCTGNETLLREACLTNSNIVTGLACSPVGTTVYCADTPAGSNNGLSEGSSGANAGMYFICSPGTGTTQRDTWVQFR